MSEPAVPVITPESASETPGVVVEAPLPAPEPREVPSMGATYHVALWTAPAPTYVCLLCTVVDLDHAGILDHLTTVHTAEAIPSPLTADYLAQNPLLMAMRFPEGVPSMSPEPADKDKPDDKDKPEHPQGGPPGQTGDHPDHPHGGPPGQPHPEHPIVEPDEDKDKA